MDAFTFDSKFARFVSLVNSDEIRSGTILYEMGNARVAKVGSQKIEGFVKSTDGSSNHVVLQTNDQGGISGSCSCDTFFNCAHAYALSRATRDHLQRRPGPQATPQTIQGKTERLSPAQSRPTSTSPSPSHPKPSLTPLEKLWQNTKQGKLPLFPNDLTAFTDGRRRPTLPPKEPLRELKRFLPDSGPANAQEFADAIRAFCDQKKIPIDHAFKDSTNPSQANARFFAYKKSQRSNSWKDAPPPLSFEFKFETTEDRDWFELTFVPKIEGQNFTRAEIDQLLNADGELVYLKGHGWRRVEKGAGENLSKKLAGLGFGPLQGNAQRVHVLQADALLSADQKKDKAFDIIARRLRSLQKLDLPSPPPSLRKTLRPYQTKGFEFLTHLSLRNLGGILADDMGLGKTLQTLSWLMWQKAEKPNLRALIICPKSVTDNWIHESKKFKTGLTATLFRPSDASCEALQKANIVVSNYSLLRLQSKYFLKQKWDVAILDEGQYIKNPNSQTAKTAFKLNAAQRLILSGTPIENKISDLWSLMHFAMPGLLGSEQSFVSDFNKTDDAHALANLRKRLQPFLLRRLKNQVAKDLPERVEEEIRCELEGEQKELYLAELQKAREHLKQATPQNSDPKARFSILASLLRLRQICCSPQLIQKESSPLPSAKVAALLDLIEPLAAEGHQVLVFSQFVSMLEILKTELDRRKIGNLSLTGKTQNRQNLVERFQKDSSHTVFLLSLKAAGSGLNLTAASYVILFDPWWNPAVEAQAIDRTHRIGQTSQVMAYRIIAKDTVEEKIRKLQTDKAALAESIIQEESLAQSLNLEDLKDLLE